MSSFGNAKMLFELYMIFVPQRVLCVDRSPIIAPGSLLKCRPLSFNLILQSSKTPRDLPVQKHLRIAYLNFLSCIFRKREEEKNL